MRWTSHDGAEKSKKHSVTLDDETIRNIGRYYGVEGRNFESLVKYIKSRGLPEDAA